MKEQMMQLHEILPYINLLLILFLFYMVWKHHFKKDKKDKE